MIKLKQLLKENREKKWEELSKKRQLNSLKLKQLQNDRNSFRK